MKYIISSSIIINAPNSKKAWEKFDTQQVIQSFVDDASMGIIQGSKIPIKITVNKITKR